MVKVNEFLTEEQIDELVPGQTPGRLNPRRYFGQGKAMAQTDKMIKNLVKGRYKLWATKYAVLANRQYKNDPERQQKVKAYLKQYLIQAFKIPQNDPFLSTEFENIIGSQGENIDNKKALQDVMNRAASKGQLAQLSTPPASNTGQNTGGGNPPGGNPPGGNPPGGNP